MQTDLHLKNLTMACGKDMLPFLGIPYAKLKSVKVLELPSSARRLDNILHMVSPHGQEYLHILEWIAYPDPLVLWRLAYYMAWVALVYPGKIIVGTVIYLTPESDMGHVLHQRIDGQDVHIWQFNCVRLYELDAYTALRSGEAGLVVLSTLMQGADEHLAEEAITFVLTQTEQPLQGELLTILSTFTENLIKPERFIAIVGRGNLMKSSVIELLLKEEREEMQAQFAQERNQLQSRLEKIEQQHTLQQSLIELILQKFPTMPVMLMKDIWNITDPLLLSRLHLDVTKANDLHEFEQRLQEVAASET